MSRIKNNSKIAWHKFLQFIFLTTLAVFWVLPVVEAPIFNKLPYLEAMNPPEKFIWSFSITVFIFFLYLLLSESIILKNGITYISGLNLKRKLLASLGFLMFVYASVDLSCNTFGTLVKIFPNKPYSAQMEVVNAETKGSKMRSVDLDLKLNTDGKVYHLTLSKSLFSYPKFKVGDKLILKGKKNWFGVYIEEFQPV